jgi:prefoldin subunit 5
MKEVIQKRIEELMAQGKQMEVNLHMINGAIQQCQWQLSELDKEEVPEEPKAE